MVGRALATTGGNKSRGIVVFDASKFDGKKAAARAEKFANAIGSNGLGGAARFPGQKYTFSQGVWYIGAGSKKKALKGEQTWVVNALRGAATWVKWSDGKPKYLPDVYHLAEGEDMPDRESLGDTDQSEWDTDENGNPQDPWKPIFILPIRDQDSDTIDHIELSTKSSVIAGFNLFKEVGESAAMHISEVPLVICGTKKAEMKKKLTDKKGKEVEKKFVWDVPTFEVLSWVDAKECDVPSGEAVEASGEVGEVETRERTPTVPKADTKAANGKKKVKPVAASEDGDGEI